MSDETHPIPQLTRTALALVQQQYQQSLSAIAEQTVTALGLDPTIKWHVDFDAGVIRRQQTETSTGAA